MTRCNTWWVVTLCCISGQFAFSAEPNTNLPNAETVWVDNENERHLIYYRHADDDGWSDYVDAVYKSKNSLTTPVLATREGGEKILFWAEQIAGSAVLKIMYGQFDAQARPVIRWGKPEVFSDLGRFNTAPTTVVDWSNNVWLFWAADVADYSDIYYSNTANLGANATSWTTPSLVHNTNKVPDNTPSARFNERGSIDVVWQSFDLQTSQYKRASRQFLLESAPRENVLSALLAEEQALIENVPSPDFLPQQQRLFVHFPNNKLIQSMQVQTLTAIPLSE